MSALFTPTFPDRCPARIFMELWRGAVQGGSTYNFDVIEPNEKFREAIYRALARGSLPEVCAGLDQLAQCSGANGRVERGRKLAIMDAIDRTYLLVHPRTVAMSSARAARSAPAHAPKWLKALAQLRLLSGGFYVADDKSRVIARGPLGRPSRRLETISADSLPDRFAALSVVPRTLTDANGREIPIEQSVFVSSGLYGVDHAPVTGREKVLFVPVLETRTELKLDYSERGSTRFVDCRTVHSVNPVDRIIGALSEESNVDIAVAPEFTMTEMQAGDLAAELRALPTALARVIVAGSGQTSDTDEDLPWNETRVLNGMGRLLWRQRKLWPAAILNPRATEFGLPDPGSAKIHEKIASGREMLVVDIDDLGRCIILICQDLENGALPGELVRLFQPDWVISPILDRGIDLGRWAHQAAWRMSKNARTRVLISCSEALTPTEGDSALPSVPCGLAVGPSEGDDSDPGRLVAALHSSGTTPRYAVVTWRSSETVWQRTVLETEDI